MLALLKQQKTLLFFIWLSGFLFNIVWEFNHCQLYLTCLNWTQDYAFKFLVLMSAKDGFFIVLFYLISVYLFKNINILKNKKQILFFVLISLSFAFIDEKISTQLGRWEYNRSMPIILGVGSSPLFEIALTGFLTFLFVFKAFPGKNS